MPLNPPSGNMYPWAYTTNPIGGECKHACVYCYVGRLRQRGLRKYEGEPFLDDSWFKTRLAIPDGYVLFVCSCYDLFGEWVPDCWIQQIVDHCNLFPDTTFLFQTRNTFRLLDGWLDEFPPKTIVGTTIETDKPYSITKAPRPWLRYAGLTWIEDQDIMVAIEPIMKFNLYRLVSWLRDLKPKFVSIGADSGKNNLDEPSAQEIGKLIFAVEHFTEVRLKKNLNRLGVNVENA